MVKPYQSPFKEVQYKEIPLASPYLFIICLEPLLRWLQQGDNIYTFGTSKVKISSAAYAHDLTAIANKLESLQTQINKLDKFCEWAGMNLGIPKYVVTGCQ